jgi:putative transposase
MEPFRISDEARVYFITYSVVDWLPVFISESASRVISDSFQYCHDHKSLRVNAFVIMPTHLHAIVFDATGNTANLNKSLIEFRKFTGRKLTEVCLTKMPSCFGKTLELAATEDRDHRFWQPSRHPVAIETEGFWRQKLNYLHENPCRKGLVRRAADWRFSSAAWYLTDKVAACDVEITQIDWS